MTTDPQEPRQEAAFFSTIRGWGIVRGDHGVFGGVIEGIGNRIGMDRVPARWIAVLAGILLTGPVLLAYAAGWGLLSDREGNIIIQNFGRGRPNVGALIMIGLLTLAGFGSIEDSGPWKLSVGNAWWPGDVIGLVVFAAVAGLIVWLVLRNRGDGGAPRASAPLAKNPGPYAATPPSAGGSTATAAPVAPQTPAKGAAGRSSKSSKESASAPAQAAAATASASTPAPAPAPTRADVPGPPPPVVRPRVPGPGRSIYLLALAASLLAAAAVWWLDREGELAISPGAAFFAVLVIIVGAAIIVVGAAGRRIGFFGFLGTMLIIGWIIALAVPGATTWFNGVTSLSIDRETIDATGLTTEEVAERAFACRAFDARLAASVESDASADTWDVATGQTNVVDSATAVVTVPEGSRIEFRSTTDGSSSTVSWERAGLTCTLEGADDIVSLGGTAGTIYVRVDTNADIVVTEAS